VHEFCERLAPLLSQHMSREQVAQLFMKIDSNVGGTVDWDEFSEYMFMARSDAPADAPDTWKLFPLVRPAPRARAAACSRAGLAV
jgi:hypothetical protein